MLGHAIRGGGESVGGAERSSTVGALHDVNGPVFDFATINELGSHRHTRKPFYSEVPGNETWGGAAATAADDEDGD
jgi:hypothetical protein